MKINLLSAALISAGVLATATLGYTQISDLRAAHAGTNEVVAAAVAPKTPVSNSVTDARGLPAFAQIVEGNGPAVVNITVTQRVDEESIAQTPQFDENGPFGEFFRRFQIPMPQERAPSHGAGSGFIVTPEGHIMTNAHVVANASDVLVRLTDRREFSAKVIGVDRQSDIALIKIDAKGLPVVKMGDPNTTKVGDWVLAIGSPFGFENSVTAGIVSAKFRTLPDETYVPFIQTDVAVNPGNSGGPLFNMNGEVIGINSQIFSRTGGYQGLSFAIPIDVAVSVKDQLLAHGKVTRGRLGVAIQDVNQSLAESFGLRQATGALVSSVEKDSPAAKAGVQSGDVILKFNGQTINRSAELPMLVSTAKPGSTADLEVWRGGATRSLEIQVGQMNDAKTAARGNAATEGGQLGLALRSLTAEEARAADLDGGLVVQSSNGPAAKAGIRPGDVLVMFNNTPIKSVDQLRDLTSKSKGRAALLVARDGAKIFVPINLG